jgi:hypothetical protein
MIHPKHTQSANTAVARARRFHSVALALFAQPLFSTLSPSAPAPTLACCCAAAASRRTKPGVKKMVIIYRVSTVSDRKQERNHRA